MIPHRSCVLAFVFAPCLAFAGFALRDATVVYCDAYEKTTGSTAHNLPFGRPAAQDLARIISLTTGAKVKAVTESQWEKKDRSSPDCKSNNQTIEQSNNSPVIYVGPCRATHGALGDRPLPAGGETGDRALPEAWNGFRIRVSGNAAYVAGPTETGSSYGVTEFIERFCGYLFLAQNGENPYEVVPDRAVPDCDFTMKPAVDRFFYRGWINGWAKPEDLPKTRDNWFPYFRQRRLLRRMCDVPADRRVRSIDGSDCHLVYKYLPTKKYAKAHPEWYSMDESGRRTSVENGDCQLCYTNPEMREEFTKNLLAMIEADKRANPTGYARVYDMGQGDNTPRLCLCPECRKVIAKYNAKAGGNQEGGDSGLQLEFANDIVRRVNRIHPEIKLRIFSYVSTAAVPKGIRAEKNVVVWWCDVYSISDHMRGLADPLNRRHYDEYLGWLATGAEVEVWDYMLYGTTPEVNAEALRNDLRFYRDHRPAGIFMESEYHYQPFYDLHEYLYDKLSWNPDADLDALIRTWCAVYGKAADAMCGIIQRLMRLERENPPKDHDHFHQRRLPWYTRENFEALARDCEAAYALEDRPFMRARVALVLAGTYDWLRKYHSGFYGKEAEVRRCTDAFARYEKEWSTVEHTDPAKRAATEKKVDGRVRVRTVRFKDLPPGCADVEPAGLLCFDCDSQRWRAAPQNLIALDKDEASETGKTCVRRYPAGKKAPDAMEGGVYDIPLKKILMNFKIPVTKEMRDGRYRWYRLGSCSIGKNSYIWITGDWQSQIPLGGLHKDADGAAVDLNNYEIWISFKFNEDWFAFDRLVLKRLTVAN